MKDSSQVKIHACGNATLIVEKNNKPIIATDPWLHFYTAYFGSWSTSYKIPSYQLSLLEKVPYIWISHSHPDHLNMQSLLKLKGREKKILLSDQHYNRIAYDLRDAGFEVIILPTKSYINLDEDINIACFPILNTVDSCLLVKIKNNLIINLNDTLCDPAKNFLKKEIKKSRNSLLLKLAGYGDADMINVFDDKNNFIEPIAASKPAPGLLLTSQAKKINCTHAMHFSSFHKYVRRDSIWANKYTTPRSDLKRGWDNKIGYFEEFSTILVNHDGFQKVSSSYPEKNDIDVLDPKKFGDDWDQELKKGEFNFIKEYLNNIEKISKNSFLIKVGSRIIESDISLSKKNRSQKFIFVAPRNSLIKAIKLNIFDDLLIGNFSRLIIPLNYSKNYRNLLKIPSKYIDNIGIRNSQELKEFLWVYRNSYDSKYVRIKSELMHKTRDLIISKLRGKNNILGKLKQIYQNF